MRRSKSKIAPILKRHDVMRAAVFGSFVRREMKESSDIDVLIHGYFGANLERVWAVVKGDLLELKPEVLRILEEVE